MNAKELAAQFTAQNNGKGKAGNIFFEGNVIYSYGYHFPIAIVLNSATKRAVLNSDKYSVSTSRQCSIVRSALISAGYTLEESDTFTMRQAIA